MLAAARTITETGEKSAQNDYIARQIAVTDTWSFYQAKSIKADIADTQAKTLAVLGATSQDKAVDDPAATAKARAAKEVSDSNGAEGKTQLRARAMRETDARDYQRHRYHLVERAVGALQIAIVLASVRSPFSAGC